MSIFKKIVSAISPKPYGYYPANLSPRSQDFIKLVVDKDFDAASAIFSALDHDDRTHLVQAVSDLIDEDQFFDSWFDNSNGPPIACLFRGALLTRRAWHYRGWGRGENVSTGRAEMMTETLEKAHRSLIPILSDAHVGQDAAAILIRTQMGLSLSWEEIDDVHAMLRKPSRPNIIGELNYLTASCEKWLGSHDMMFDFARKTIEKYHNSAELGALIAVAHWERQHYLDLFEEDEAAGDFYRQDMRVNEEVKIQSRRLLSTSKTNDKCLVGHNYFAAFFCDRSDWESAKPHFEKMKRGVCKMPWSFYDASYLNQVYNISLL